LDKGYLLPQSHFLGPEDLTFLRQVLLQELRDSERLHSHGIPQQKRILF